MSTLDFIKSDDTSDVVFADAASDDGEDVVSTHRFTRRKGAGQPSSSEMIDLGDDLEVEDTEVPANGKKGELPLVVGKDTKALGKKVGGSKPSGKAIESSSIDDS
ncbi:hypothetical protein HanXRQr2_Chr02g0075471 [Helianthus annuus]|uniref:Uncharacterized protein n=1 Tax=Helianthus annuus TaxID=4232 RepID=A0A9K3P0C4_HELAN|nr:hypothetical protein HanXRQr2_Chr02g0075471 [Helianthus annuus]KAJ0619445.1 hypothetical protein HanHA89_Chr02g0071451 [Helianthus annuus]